MIPYLCANCGRRIEVRMLQTSPHTFDFFYHDGEPGDTYGDQITKCQCEQELSFALLLPDLETHQLDLPLR